MNLKQVIGVSLLCCAVHGLASAQNSVVLGQDEWLFTKYEFADPADAADTKATIQLLTQVNKSFEKRQIQLALVMVPSKIRIHADKLPKTQGLDAYTNGKYDAALKELQAGGVHVVNLNQAFLANPNRQSDNPLFLRLDTHWSHTGAFAAAEAIKATFDADPALKAAWSATPTVQYGLTWANRKIATRSRDLVKLLPPEAQTYAPEQVLQFKVNKTSETSAGLLGDANSTQITVIGSSYSNKNTGYPDALRYVLQRDLLDISIPVDQGPWVGMMNYVKNDAFKTAPPKLIIWEIPERELRSPPNYKYRDARYVIDNSAWLSEISRLIEAR